MRLFSFILSAFLSAAIIPATFISTFISIKPTHAEPNPIIARLMNEPLSMLDYGLWRTEIELKRYFISMNNIYIAARYNWQEDKIAIEVLLNELPLSLQELKENERCEFVINSIKNYFGGDKNKNTLLGKSFIHNGYAGMDISQDELFRKLDNMTHIYVSVIKNSKAKNPKAKKNGLKIDYSNFLSCNSTLVHVGSD